MLSIFKRKYIRLLSCHLLHKKIKLYNYKQFENDIKFRFEYEGSYLTEYYMRYDDALLAIKVNKGNLVLNNQSYMVYSLANQVLCIVSS